MSRTRLSCDEQSFLLSSSRLVISRYSLLAESVPTRLITIKPFQLDILRACARRYTRTHTREDCGHAWLYAISLSAAWLAKPGHLQHCTIILHASQFSSYLHPRQYLLTEIDVHLSSSSAGLDITTGLKRYFRQTVYFSASNFFLKC